MSDIIQSAAPEAASIPAESEEQVVQDLPKASPESSKIESLEKKEAAGELTKKEEKQLKEYRLKVNGRDKVVKFNPHDDNEVTKYLQKAEAADLKFQEAAEVRKAAMEFIEELRKNPRRVLADPNIGIDVKKFAEQILNEEIQEMEKTPEQREREKLQKELEELKKQAQDREEAAKKAEFERLQMEQERILESEITAALDVGGMPKTARTVKAMAEMMMIALENGIDLSPKDIAPIVKNTTMGEFKELISSLSDDQLEDFMGDAVKRLQKRRVAKAKAAPTTASSVKPTSESLSKKVEQAPAKKMTIRDFLKV